jgi:hypothetical protein
MEIKGNPGDDSFVTPLILRPPSFIKKGPKALFK